MTYEVFLLKGQPIDNPIRGKDMDTYVGVIGAGELVSRYRIARRDFARNTGYQRNESKTRVNKLVRDLRNRKVDLPTALLLSVRADQNLRPEIDASGRYILSLYDNGEKPFYVVDGQHRLEALRKLIVEEQDESWVDYKIPVVIFFGSDEYMEMGQFHIVNANAKNVATDLSQDLLTTRARTEPSFRKYLDETGELWKVTTQELTETVSTKGVWSNRIRFPNQPKGSTLITSNAFASSLRRVIGQDNFSSYLPTERAEIITSYWSGIAMALPACFTSPEDYNIQKTVGVNVLHDLLTSALTWAIRFGSPVTLPETYKGILGQTLKDLSGDNSRGSISVGADFWKVGSEGASGAFSGGAGRRVLGQRIKTALEANLREQQ